MHRQGYSKAALSSPMQSFREYLLFLNKTSVQLRIDVLEMLNRAQSGHLGGSLSALDMLILLYYGQLPAGPIMNFDVDKPGWDGQDYFILSKAHAAPALYAVLADVGFIDKEELKHLRQVNSMLQAYPSKKTPGIPVDSGQPGHGFSAAVGLAMALKADKQPNRVFCMVGDGELQEGLVWEAAMTASHHKLDNLTLLVDVNDLQMDGLVRGIIGVDPIVDKFQSFGWKTILVIDGHDFEQLLFAYERALENQRRPSVVIAKTIKGKGVVFAENKPSYHAEVLSNQEMAEAIPRLQMELMSLNKAAK